MILNKEKRKSVHPKEHYKMLSRKFKGVPRSQEVRDKISKTLKGRIVPEEEKIKMSEGRKGIKLSNEHRKNIGLGNLGKKRGKYKTSGYKHSEKTRRKISNGRRKWRERNGIKPAYLTITLRTSDEYKEWRLMVFGRDDFMCQDCGIKGEYLNAHHVISFSSLLKKYNIKNREDARKCSELWDINNGITLCKECHLKRHKTIIEIESKAERRTKDGK